MNRYCLETNAERSAILHRVDCSDYDLGTLLGIGCVVDLGEYPSAAQALQAIKGEHPDVMACTQCCKAPVTHLPLLRQATLLATIAVLST